MGRTSGTQSLPLGELSAVAPSSWLAICSLMDPSPRPRTVRIHVGRAEWTEPHFHERLPAGVWWAHGDSFPWIGWGAEAQCGALRFRYGSQGVQRVLLADLASGEYQIPACEYLAVEATRYTPSDDLQRLTDRGYASELEVSGEIVDGTIADFTPLMLTAPSSWYASEDPQVNLNRSSLCACPPGAYAFELYPDSPWVENNAFEVYYPGAVRSFADSVQLPPASPLPVVAPFVGVQCRGTEPQPCRLVFFVR
jgi:hypothetical protein